MSKEIIAIMGPSGSGKTTLGYNLSTKKGIIIPRHVTTRSRRPDDRDDFYRYYSHDEYRNRFEKGEFIISSGDNPVIDPKYGNYYGVLYRDCNNAWEISPIILLFVSYKDIQRLNDLRSDYDVRMINVSFQSLVDGMKSRLLNNPHRNHTVEEVERRIRIAQEDYDKYHDLLEKYADGTIYTDIRTKKETYQEACKILQLK